MAENKTKPTEVTVGNFLDSKTDGKTRKDSESIISLMEKITGEKPKMWGPSIIGFGQYHYKYESGREGDICLVGFSPRKPEFVLYVLTPFDGKDILLEKLGKHKAKGGCLYIKRLDDIDLNVLEEVIKETIAYTRSKYPG